MSSTFPLGVALRMTRVITAFLFAVAVLWAATLAARPVGGVGGRPRPRPSWRR